MKLQQIFIVLFISVLFVACGTAEDPVSTSSTLTTTSETNTTLQTPNTQAQNTNAPVFTSFNLLAAVPENSIAIGNISYKDDDNDSVTFTLSGADAALLEYNTSTSQLSFKSAKDYESDKHSYSFSCTLFDGVHSVSRDVTFSLLNEFDVVATLNDFTASTPENVAIGTLIGTLSVVSSGDSNISSFTLSGTGSSDFRIDSEGKISVNCAINYETLVNHQYNLQVLAYNSAGYSEDKNVTITVSDVPEKDVRVLVVIMNWNDYAQSDETLWADKIFNKSQNSVATWYEESSGGEINLLPVSESSGVANNGVIIVNMGVNHPGGSNNTSFRNTYITNAITSSTVADNVDFAALDTNGNGDLDISELQIIFIVAGGEESYGDPVSHSIWAHAWSFESSSTLAVDGVTLMKYNGNPATSGSYSRFGANHGGHSATIGVITHELGHAMLSLRDFYDDGGGSGLGWYDVMSGGAWAKQPGDLYDGETPTQFSSYNKTNAGLSMKISDINSSQVVTLKCSANEQIKLTTVKANEYFLVECRDTTKLKSDISFETLDSGFTNRLFAVLYHVDDDKTTNTESGLQTQNNHYNISIVDKDGLNLMTDTVNINAHFSDIYLQGDIIATSKTSLYDGSSTNYALEVIDTNTTARTMTIQITR